MESDLNGDSSDYYRQFMPAGSERHCFFGTFTEHKRFFYLKLKKVLR